MIHSAFGIFHSQFDFQSTVNCQLISYLCFMILITGASGELGAQVLFDLVKAGKKVRALRRNTTDLSHIRTVFHHYSEEPERLFNEVEWVEGDLLDIFSLEDALEGIDEVYHCGAIVSFLKKDHQPMLRVNTQGTANLVNACLQKKIRKLCHVSSIAALGRPEIEEKVIDEELSWKTSRNNSVYAISKYGAEREVWRGVAEGLNAVIVNPGIILGIAKNQKGSSRLFITVRNGLMFYPPGMNGFVDVLDVSRAMIQLMESDIAGERFILTGVTLSYRELFSLIAEHFGRPAPRWKTNLLLTEIAWRAEGVRSAMIRKKPLITKETARTSRIRFYYSNEKIKKVLGFEFTPTKKTIRRYCEHYQNNIR